MGKQISEYLNQKAQEIGFPTYAEYLNGTWWAELTRREKKNQCFCCRSSNILQLHHINYERLGRELSQDLITVCDRCHTLIHSLIAGGTRLENAHWQVKKQQQKKGDSNWVRIENLVNKSKHQTLTQLFDFMRDEGLLAEGNNFPSEKAFKERYAKLFDGQPKWNRRHYISMMKRRKKSAKQRSKRLIEEKNAELRAKGLKVYQNKGLSG